MILKVTMQPQPIEGFVGERACIICSAEGPNPITYLWLKSITKDGRKVTVKESKSITISGEKLEFELVLQHWGHYSL